MDTLDHGSLGKMPILPIRERWTLLLIAMIVALLLSIVGLFDAIEISDLVNRTEQGDMGAAMKLDRMQRQGIKPLNLLMGIVGIACVVFVCMWFYRAAQNVHQAGMRQLNYSPGWNVGWFFIPVAHIVMPVIVLKETVKATLSLNDQNEYSNWQHNKTMPAFKIWAICYILRMASVYVMVFNAVSYARQAALGDTDALIGMYKFSAYYSFASVAISFIEGIALITFTKKITALQEEYRKN